MFYIFWMMMIWICVSDAKLIFIEKGARKRLNNNIYQINCNCIVDDIYEYNGFITANKYRKLLETRYKCNVSYYKELTHNPELTYTLKWIIIIINSSSIQHLASSIQWQFNNNIIYWKMHQYMIGWSIGHRNPQYNYQCKSIWCKQLDN